MPFIGKYCLYSRSGRTAATVPPRPEIWLAMVRLWPPFGCKLLLTLLKLKLGVTSLVTIPFSAFGPATLLKFNSSKYRREKLLNTSSVVVFRVYVSPIRLKDRLMG